jgi:hypothetical protein
MFSWTSAAAVTVVLAAQTPPAPAPPPSTAAQTPEIARVDALVRLANSEARLKGSARPEFVQALVVTIEDTMRAIADESGATSAMKLDAPELHGSIEDWVLKATRSLPDAEQARREALLDVVQKATTRVVAAAFLDQWLGLAPPAATAAPTNKPVLVQLQATSSSDALAIDTTKLQLTGDVGGNGGGNGVIDEQEWVSFVVPVANRGPLPWFTASARATTDHPCLWVDGTKRRLPELPVGGDPVTLAVLAYVASDCTSSAPRTLAVQIEDTYRGSTGAQLKIEVAPTPAVRLKPGTPRLEADGLGFSDSSSATVLAPGVRAEFSIDVNVDGRIGRAQQSFTVPRDLQPAFRRLEHDDELPLLDGGRGLWRAADDLDIELAGEQRFVDVFLGARASERFVATGQTGRLWVGVDIAYEPVLPTAPAAAKKPDEAAPPPRPVPDVSAVLGLLQKHMSIEAHPEKPTLQGGMAATTGYEVVVDRERFAAAWAELTKTPTTTATTTAPPPSALRYARRLYVALPTQAVARAAPAVVPEPEPDAPPPPPPPPPPPSPPIALRLDVGGGVQLGAHGGDAAPVRQTPGAEGGARLWVGREAALVVGATVAGGRYGFLGGFPSVVVLEGGVDVGGGYRLHLGAFEVAPSVTVGFAHRTLSDERAGARTPTNTPTAGAGVTGSWNFVGPVSVFVDVRGRWSLDGPAVSTTSLDDDVFFGSSARARFGLAFDF